MTEELLDTILSALESRELRSLQWGFVDGAIAEADLEALVGSHVGGDDAAVEAVLQELQERCLLFEFEGAGGEYQYRTRFAEGVRLLSRLKQLFPGVPWASAPDLVSDFRVHAGKRAFPRREVPVGELTARLAELPGWSSAHQAMVGALIPPTFRLAGFQVRATEAILRKEPPGGGVVVCAGTGSGKTLAFYYPALTQIGTLVKKGEYWTKAVALYPRVELLKDQFSEAYTQARRLEPLLKKRGARPIRLGTLFSLTPRDATPKALEQAKWPKKALGFVCPFLVCPECEGELLWLDADLTAGQERLRCARGARCPGKVTGEEVILTRTELKKSPPDLLFTTTETLNSRLADPAMRHLFGVTPARERAVRLVLLDEIHTYSGVAGAQTALLFRRWRRLLPPDVRFVGLSATLQNAPTFLATLVGLEAERVQETSPLAHEMDYQTMAYQIVLRGNPASQTQLLSTSVQASFLLARLMDGGLQEGEKGRSKGLVGQKTFVFTDDLDVTNRLYDILREVEAHDIFGNPDAKSQPLAALRDSAQGQLQQRRRAGQYWEVVEEIRGSGALNRRLHVTRTSSQDAGVERKSDLTVATASLEVGFDDPLVGAVLQHKSPHDMASFLQRKGRAGRTRLMRPWMVTVLSDFGRDRLTYQEYERLFDPVLSQQWLPIKNRYILRMQAALTLMDWLAGHLPGGNQGPWVWRVLNGPAKYPGDRQAQAQIQELLTKLLSGASVLRTDLYRALRSALGIDDPDELHAILWEPPRSLMLDVIPTLLRRLATKWEVHPTLQPDGGPARLDRVPAQGVHPLPDFIPTNLFSPLNLPDVTIQLPPATKRDEEREERLGIVQAMNQLAPGRITRRFAPERGKLYHWIPVPLVAGQHDLPLREYAEELETVASFTHVVEGVERAVTLYRPWAMRLTKAQETEVKPSSNAMLLWEVSILPPDEATELATEADARFRELLDGGRFYLHQFRTPVTLRRFALGASANLRLPGGREDLLVDTRFVDETGAPAAVGFESEVDGFCLNVTLPPTEALLVRIAAAGSRGAWHVAFFQHQIYNDPVLVQETNHFDREWLFQVFFSALTARAALDSIDLSEALERVRHDDPRSAFAKVLDGIFQVDPNALQEDDDEPIDAVRNARPTRRASLLDLLSSPVIRGRLVDLARQIGSPEPAHFGPWLVDRLAESLAEATLQASQRMAPRHIAPESLLVDYRPAPSGAPNGFELWVTEATTGGVGALEAMAAAVISTPHLLFAALEATLVPGDQEVVSMGLARFIELVESMPAVASAVAHVRDQVDHARHDEAFATLRSVLARHGLAVDASLAVALHQRILRQGTSPESDQLLADLLRYWVTLEGRLGVTLDLRTFAYVAVSVPAFADRVTQLFRANTGEALSPEIRVAALTGILWAHPHEHRSRVLQSYSPFRRSGWTDPALVRELVLADRVSSVRYGEAGWAEQLRRALADDATVKLQVPSEQERAFQVDLVRLLAEPVTFQDLQFYPALERVEREGRHTVATLTIKEMI